MIQCVKARQAGRQAGRRLCLDQAVEVLYIYFVLSLVEHLRPGVQHVYIPNFGVVVAIADSLAITSVDSFAALCSHLATSR